MKIIIHPSETRGAVNLGWLKSRHTFSFGNYHNPERMHFGALRVLNDDYVIPGAGFGTHPHDNIEIITIPLSGTLEHKDSMGNKGLVKTGEIQVMSAGTGIYHSEYNASNDVPVEFLQIWLFPNKREVAPRYDQVKIDEAASKNDWLQLISPNPSDDGAWIHQRAWFHIGELDAGKSLNYTLKDAKNGVYAFVIHGIVQINGETLSDRDGIGIWETESLQIKAINQSKILIMEVPLNS